MLFTDAIDCGSLGLKIKMKTTLYIIVLMLSSLVLLSCNRRERELKKELLETQENLLKTKEEFIEVKEELVITEQLLNESDERFNKIINRLEVAVTEIQKLKEENDNLRKENTTLKNQVKNKNSSYKPLPEPKSLPEPKPFFFGSNIKKEENKRVPITHDEMKQYLVSFKSTTNEIKQYLLSLADIDRRRKDTFSQSSRNSRCNSIIYRAKDMNYYLMNKKKILQNNNSSIQYIKTIQNIQQNLNIIIESCITHKDLKTKAEMDTCTTGALQALERINGIIDNF